MTPPSKAANGGMSPQLSTPFLNFVRWGCDVSGDSSIFSPSELISGATAVVMSSGPAAEWVSSVAVAVAVRRVRQQGARRRDVSALLLGAVSRWGLVLCRRLGEAEVAQRPRGQSACELRVLLCELDPQET